MYYCIAFQAVFIPVVINIPINRLCIYAKVADAKSFEEKTECIQVGHQVFDTKSEGCSRDGWIDEIASVCGAYGSTGTQVGIPGGQVFDDKDFLFVLEVGKQRVFATGMVVFLNILQQFCRRCL